MGLVATQAAGARQDRPGITIPAAAPFMHAACPNRQCASDQVISPPLAQSVGLASPFGRDWAVRLSDLTFLRSPRTKPAAVSKPPINKTRCASSDTAYAERSRLYWTK